MTIPHWQHYPHEADIGIEGSGATKAEAFEQAALALTAVITAPEKVRPSKAVEIHCEAPNDELLFVDWLNALIYSMVDHKMLFGRFEVTIEDHQLHARAWGEKIDRERHQPAVEIKGATYTSLKVYQDNAGVWHAQTVVDV